jgi:hypothetical protein
VLDKKVEQKEEYKSQYNTGNNWNSNILPLSTIGDPASKAGSYSK